MDSRGSKQFKSVVYLTDVTKDNGPFMFLPNSNNLNLPIREDDPHGRNTRFTDDGVDSCGIEPFIVTSNKGTVVLVDTSYIHRGSIINKGSRYALTTYYYGVGSLGMAEEKWGEYWLKK